MLIQIGRSRKGGESPPLRAIGRQSYEIYLTHMFVIFGFFRAFEALFGKRAPYQEIYPVSYVIMLVLSVLLGYGVCRWFSEPANRALRARFSGRNRLDASVKDVQTA